MLGRGFPSESESRTVLDINCATGFVTSWRGSYHILLWIVQPWRLIAIQAMSASIVENPNISVVTAENLRRDSMDSHHKGSKDKSGLMLSFQRTQVIMRTNNRTWKVRSPCFIFEQELYLIHERRIHLLLIKL